MNNKVAYQLILALFILLFVSFDCFALYRVSESFWKTKKGLTPFSIDISQLVVKKDGISIKFSVPVEVNLGLYEYLRVGVSTDVVGELNWGWRSERTGNFIYPSNPVLLVSDGKKHSYTFSLRFSDGNNPIFDKSRELIFEFISKEEGSENINIDEITFLPYSQDVPRQVTIGGICMDSIWEEAFEIKMQVHENARLVFYTGIYNPALGSFEKDKKEISWDTDGVNFVIKLFSNSEEKDVFSYKMDPKNVIEDRVWRKHELILPIEKEGEIVIKFSIDNLDTITGDFAVWGNPILEEDCLYENDDTEIPVFLISCDTLRPDHLIPYGYALPTSPNLDNFAKDAVVFESAYTTQTFTPVAHMCMLSGLYPKNHGLTRNTDIRRDIEILPEILRGKGYYTVGITGFLWWFIPSRGFSRGMDYFSVPLSNLPGMRRDVFEVNKEAIEFISNAKSKKIFVFLHNYDVHSVAYGDLLYDAGSDEFRIFSSNLDVPNFGIPECLNGAPIGRIFLEHAVLGDFVPDVEHIQFINALYDDCVFKVDYALGEFFEYLKEKGLYDRAFISIVSDHGESLGEHNLFGHDNVYEESMRCLMMMKFPHNRYAGVRVKDKVLLEDIFPTILDELNFEYSGTIDGKSLIDLIEGKSSGRDYVFSVSLRGDMRAVIKDDYKLLVNIPKGINYFFNISQNDGEYYNINIRDERTSERISVYEQIYSKVFGVEKVGWWFVFKNNAKPWWNSVEIKCSSPIRNVEIYRGILRTANERTDSCTLKAEVFLPAFTHPIVLQILPSEEENEIMIKLKNFTGFLLPQKLNHETIGEYTIFSFKSKDFSNLEFTDSFLSETSPEERIFGVFYFPFNSSSPENETSSESSKDVNDTLKNLGYF